MLVVMTDIAILALFAASLQFFMGHGGITSFGHAAFFGLGAYASALLLQKAALPMALAFVAAPLARPRRRARRLVRAALAGRVRGMLTLAFAQILWSTATQWIALTGGDNGILGVWPPAWLSGKAGYVVFALLITMAMPVAAAPRGVGAVRLCTARDARCAGACRCLRHRGDARAMAGVLRRRTVRGPCRRLNAFHKGSVFRT